MYFWNLKWEARLLAGSLLSKQCVSPWIEDAHPGSLLPLRGRPSLGLPFPEPVYGLGNKQAGGLHVDEGSQGFGNSMDVRGLKPLTRTTGCLGALRQVRPGAHVEGYAAKWPRTLSAAQTRPRAPNSARC